MRWNGGVCVCVSFFGLGEAIDLVPRCKEGDESRAQEAGDPAR